MDDNFFVNNKVRSSLIKLRCRSKQSLNSRNHMLLDESICYLFTGRPYAVRCAVCGVLVCCVCVCGVWDVGMCAVCGMWRMCSVCGVNCVVYVRCAMCGV